MAKTILRLQRVEREEGKGEIGVHACQSGEAKTGGTPGLAAGANLAKASEVVLERRHFVVMARNPQGKLVTTDGKTVQGKEGLGVLGVDIFGGCEGVGGPKLGAKLKKDLSLQFPPAHKAQMTS